MGLRIDNNIQVDNNIINNLCNKVQSFSSKILNLETNEFADYLNENYENIDKNKDKSLNSNEIKTSIQNNSNNKELEALINNNNIEKLISNVDINNDNLVTKNETTPESNIPNILKGALREIQNTKNLETTAINLAQNLCQNYYLSPQITNLTTNAVSYLI